MDQRRRSTRIITPRATPVTLPARSNKKALAGFTNTFQRLVMKQLKPKSRAPSESGKFPISRSLFNSLKGTHGVTGHFRTNATFINFLSLENIRYFNNTDYCSFDKKLIRVRVGRTGNTSYLNQHLEEVLIKSNSCQFSYQFVRYEGKRPSVARAAADELLLT